MNPAAPVMSALVMEGSVRVLVEDRAPRAPQDLDVEAERPVLDVIEVVLDALLDGRVAAPAVHLRPSGHAALHLVAQHVPGDALLELLDEARPLRARPYQGHVALEHVQELRQLV